MENEAIDLQEPDDELGPGWYIELQKPKKGGNENEH